MGSFGAVRPNVRTGRSGDDSPTTGDIVKNIRAGGHFVKDIGKPIEDIAYSVKDFVKNIGAGERFVKDLGKNIEAGKRSVKDIVKNIEAGKRFVKAIGKNIGAGERSVKDFVKNIGAIACIVASMLRFLWLIQTNLKIFHKESILLDAGKYPLNDLISYGI